VADTVNETLFDEFIRHQVYLERFKANQLRDLQRFLQELQDDVSAVLGKRLIDVTTAGTINTKRLQELLKDLQTMSDEVARSMQEAQILQMRDLASYEAGWTLATLETVIPVAISFNTLSAAQLWAAVNARPFEGRLMKEWFRDYSQAQKFRITQQVRMSVIEGETVEQTIRRIRGTRAMGYRDGAVQGLLRRSAEALARTTIAHVAQTARHATFENNSDVISSVQWVSVLDGRTSPICRSRDGKTFPLNKGPRPPAHPNCRSTIVPVTKSWKELGIDLEEAPKGTRVSMNGAVPAETTYSDWLQRQPQSFQDDVLGEAKGKLFRDGGLTLDKFVDENTGRGLTLDQLRKLHPGAFQRAGI